MKGAAALMRVMPLAMAVLVVTPIELDADGYMASAGWMKLTIDSRSTDGDGEATAIVDVGCVDDSPVSMSAGIYMGSSISISDCRGEQLHCGSSIGVDVERLTMLICWDLTSSLSRLL